MEAFHKCLMALGFLVISKYEAKSLQRALYASWSLSSTGGLEDGFAVRYHPIPHLTSSWRSLSRGASISSEKNSVWVILDWRMGAGFPPSSVDFHLVSCFNLNPTLHSSLTSPCLVHLILSLSVSYFFFSAIIKLLGCGRDLASWTRRGVPWFQTHMRTFNPSPWCEPLSEIPSPQQAEWTCFSSRFSFPNNNYLCWIWFCSSKLLIQSFIYCCHLSCSLCLFGFDCFF